MALSYAVHTAGESGLNKTSTLVAGAREALLVDGQLTLAEQHRVVAAVLDSGRRLVTVFVTTAEPACYAGLQALRQAFPKARVVASPAVAERIKETWQASLETWRGLGPNLAGEVIVPDVLTAGRVELEGRVFEVRGGEDGAGPHGRYLWQPEDRALLGGALVFAGLHPWTADAASAADRAAWDRALAEAQRLGPAFVAPGHRAEDSATDASALAFTREYLGAFEEELAAAADSAALKAAMLRRYPGLGGLLNLDLGAKAATGELSWA
ncbi:MBL fold metallo-hydrolase [Streptomyces hoynatensis]|uniref:MBL fold metallo-hydrolase n=1 Tax=Streptomyces hoynatensis TaxID=1141874 RepID=A0A3A9YQG8_9ACTN|nr:MBL fold metallo-hydrolase [Streptomyces hoynatensis]RKN37744.1 MBL fold metallo-hydrolase [Streptomyces hoynatensis]